MIYVSENAKCLSSLYTYISQCYPVFCGYKRRASKVENTFTVCTFGGSPPPYQNAGYATDNRTFLSYRLSTKNTYVLSARSRIIISDFAWESNFFHLELIIAVIKVVIET